MKYSELKDSELINLINNRWISSDDIWSTIKKVTEYNTSIYKGESNWTNQIPSTRPKPSGNRVFVNTEAVINSLIANPPSPNVLPTRKEEDAKKKASAIEVVLSVRYDKINTKEIMRQGLRDLYLSRIIVIKPFWNKKKDNFDARRVDPNKVRFSSTSKNEDNSDFAIEEIDTTVQNLISMFKDKEKEILESAGFSEEDLLVKNPTCTYREAWIGNELIIKYNSLILFKGNNPYWDWDGVLATNDEMIDIESANKGERGGILGEMRKAVTDDGENMQKARRKEYEGEGEENVSYESYLFNYFDSPRKPYIFATVLGNADQPIGMTSFIEQAGSLQEVVDRTIYQIYVNTEMVNGITKVDSGMTNLSKADAQVLRYDANGVIWGKGVMGGIGREFGQGLPSFVFNALTDYRTEIDNIMASSSAFRGEREGSETKGGRLALVEQSFLRLNELVQTVDYVSQELFGWWLQLMKVKYTEEHLVKQFGEDDAIEIYSISQNDIEDGIEVKVISGKSLPEDNQFKYFRAQSDFGAGLISPLKYLEDAGYQNPREVAIGAYEFANNPAGVLGIEKPQPQGQPPVAGMQELPQGQELAQQPPQLPPELPPIGM